ncbi:805_t:CDS:2, partial [Gigaspora rosea]
IFYDNFNKTFVDIEWLITEMKERNTLLEKKLTNNKQSKEEELSELKKMNEKTLEDMKKDLETKFQMTIQSKEEELNELKKTSKKTLEDVKKALKAEFQKNIQDKEKELETLKKANEKMLKGELDQARIRLNEKEKEIVNYHENLQSIEKMLNQTKSQLCEKEKELCEKEIELCRNIRENRSRNWRIKDLKNNLNNEITELKNNLVQKEKKINELEASKSQLIKLIIKHKNLTKEIRTKQSELEQLKNSYIKTFKAFRFVKKSEIEKNLKTFLTAQAEIIRHGHLKNSVDFATEQKKDAEVFLQRKGGFNNLDKLEKMQIHLTQLEIELEDLGKLDTLEMQLKDIRKQETYDKNESKYSINTSSQSLTQPIQPLTIIINTSGPEDAAKILQSSISNSK